MEGFDIKVFDETHIPEAAQIERLCFSEPWSENALIHMCTAPTAFAIAVVDKDNGRLAAYGGVQCIPPEADIINIATHPDYRRLGCATALLSTLEDYLKGRGVDTVYLEVRVSNTPARTLYEKEGFAPCGIIKNYYRFPAEDAVEMMKKLN